MLVIVLCWALVLWSLRKLLYYLCLWWENARLSEYFYYFIFESNIYVGLLTSIALWVLVLAHLADCELDACLSWIAPTYLSLWKRHVYLSWDLSKKLIYMFVRWCRLSYIEYIRAVSSLLLFCTRYQDYHLARLIALYNNWACDWSSIDERSSASCLKLLFSLVASVCGCNSIIGAVL